MLIANIEADEIINQITTSLTKREWKVQYNIGDEYDPIWGPELNYKPRDKNKLKKIFRRLRFVDNVHYRLIQNVHYPSLADCKMVFDVKMKSLHMQILWDDFTLWLGPDDGSNFRYKSAITLPYKGTRGKKPEILVQFRQWLIDYREAVVIYGYEADDALGIYQNKDDEVIETVAVHCDKDIFQIPGRHYDTYRNEFVNVGELGKLTLESGKVRGTGLYFFYYQMLVGDITDNIPPLVKGKGPVWAFNQLTYDGVSVEEEDLLKSICKLYAQYLEIDWKKRLLEQADLVWICRDKKEIGSIYILRRHRELFGDNL